MAEGRERNNPCWCGSGKKLKKCHGETKSKEPPLATGSRILRRQFSKRVCLHPLASRSECDQVISAHTIQRSRTLARLVNKANHVGHLRPDPMVPFKVSMKQIGWKDASTFTGFCGRHDNSTFRALETRPFVADPEQCFLVAYRAVCHEVFNKRAASSAHESVIKLAEHHHRKIPDALKGYSVGLAASLAEMERLKRSSDEALLAEHFKSWRNLLLRFTGPLSVASTGLHSPTFDLDGRRLQDLGDLNVPTQSVAVSVEPTISGFTWIFSWPNGSTVGEALARSVEMTDRDLLASRLVQYLFLQLENIYFSIEWWDAQSEQARRGFQHLALTVIESAPQRYVHSELVPWKLEGVTRA